MCFKPIVIAATFLLVAVTTFTEAQNAPVDNTLPSANKFSDIVEANFSAIGSYEGLLTMGIRNVFILKSNTDFSFGLGIGIASYADGDHGALSLPLSVDLRWYFNNNKAAFPFLNLNGGYDPTLSNGDFYSGIFIGLNLGVNLIATNNLSLQLAVGVKLDNYGLFNEAGFGNRNIFYVPLTIGVAF